LINYCKRTKGDYKSVTLCTLYVQEIDFIANVTLRYVTAARCHPKFVFSEFISELSCYFL
jgi:hypothetical protein